MTVKIKKTNETGIEDVQSIITDISEFHQKFINPIDRLRSIGKPSFQNEAVRSSEDQLQNFITKNNFNSIEINTNRPLESRAHCFYRMLGLPVMDPTGSFYNPGFEPNLQLALNKREKINSTLLGNKALNSIMKLRESDVQNRRAVFANQDSNSTSYANSTIFIRSFSEYFNKDLGPLDADKQTYVINEREFKTTESQRHILRPFIVNPQIADTVIPAENLICVPFLPNKESSKIDVNKYLLRPGIEFILRLRLQNNIDDNAFLSEVVRTFNQEDVSSESLQDIKNAMFAITGDLSVLDGNYDISNTINSFSSVQINTVNMLIKSIKFLAEHLFITTIDFELIKAELNFESLPNIEGPEFGGVLKVNSSVFDQKIGMLKVKDLNAQIQNKITLDALGGGNELFALSIVSNTQKNYSEEIAGLTRQRDEIGSRGINHLSEIEKITGDVSGLGLIDVLSIYTALWAIDIETLLGFLDDSSFNRLYDFNPALRNAEVVARKGGKTLNGLEVLKRFETKLFNILSFADKAFKNAGLSPNDVDNGDI